MPTEILVPKLGMTMTEGTVAEWLVADGSAVQAGELIYRLETEKITMEIETEVAGIVRHLVKAGTTVPPGTTVAYVLVAGEAMPETRQQGASGSPPAVATAITAKIPESLGRQDGRALASPLIRRLAREAGIALDAIAGSGAGGRITEEDVARAKAAPAPAAPPAAPLAVTASPVARLLAQSLGIELDTIRGTGPGGRVTKEDVELAATAPRPASSAPARAPAVTSPADHNPGEIIPMRAMRKVIAERMHASLTEMAQLTLGMDVIMDEVVKLRGQLLEEWQSEGIRPAYTDFIIKAVAKALRQHPLLNAKVTTNGIELERDVNVGLAVAVKDGLVVPVVNSADTLSLREIAIQSAEMAEAARAGRLSMDLMAGQTFSVTAMGMMGVDFFTPIINPPNVAILGVGRIHDGVKWEGDRPTRVQLLTLSLTIDHRAVDGAPGAAFVGTVKALLEAPYRLLV